MKYVSVGKVEVVQTALSGLLCVRRKLKMECNSNSDIIKDLCYKIIVDMCVLFRFLCFNCN